MHWTVASAADVKPLPEADVEGAVQMLRSASLRELRNEAFLRGEFLLALGLNGEILDEFPRELY